MRKFSTTKKRKAYRNNLYELNKHFMNKLITCIGRSFEEKHTQALLCSKLVKKGKTSSFGSCRYSKFLRRVRLVDMLQHAFNAIIYLQS